MTDVVVVGSYVQDLAFRTETFPSPGETRIGEFFTGPGGKGFNQAVAAHRQNVDALFIGAIGDDLFGKGVQDFAETEGMATRFEVMPAHATGAASIVVNQEAENLIVVSLGACDHLSAAHVEESRSAVRESRVVLTQAECNLLATERILTLAREEDAISIFNTAPINPGVTRSLIQLADVLTPNETEFIFLAEKLFDHKLASNFYESSPEELHKICQLAGVPTVILTLGARGVFVSHNPAVGAPKLTDDKEYYFSPAFSVDAIDTTGAGDAFSGGLASGIVKFPDAFGEAVRYANAVAALSTTKPGTSPAMPTESEVQALLASS